jgi:ABC-2 type transport system ATP-binding protein
MDREISISVKQLSKKYTNSNSLALNNLSVDLFNGEIFGFLGPNGAGKTTFFSILCGLFPPTNGTVNVLGFDLKSELESVKKIIGVVPQDIALYPSLSGRDNLLYIGRMYGVRGVELKQKVNNFLDFFGFDDNRNKSVKTYSGGMKRKINLIGGLLHDPDILLLDEPTVGMDVQTRTAIMEYLKELNKEKKMTIIYTSHYLEQAEHFCDRIAILNKGNILKLGSPKDLILAENQSNLEELFLNLTGNKINS